MLDIIFLDYLGTFAFSAFGAYLAQRKGYDIFGVLTCAFISAFSGGTIREVLLNNLPTYFFDYKYSIAVLLGTVFAVIFYKNFRKINSWMLGVDAIGLVTFAYIGASRANEANLGFFGIVIFAVLTAAGGGIIRDIVMRETPIIFYQDFYATPAFLLAIGYFFLRDYSNTEWVLYTLLACTFFIRILAIKFKVQLWKPHELENQKEQ